MASLLDEHADHLDNIINGGLMKKVTPLHVANVLLDHGYIKKATGGFMVTESGHKAYMKWQELNGKQ